MTLRRLVADAAARLQSAGLSREEATQSASALARFVLGWSGADWVARSRDTVTGDFAARFAPLIARRARHEPVAYITGEREFYGRVFHVTPDVLVPRPETELIVDLALGISPGPSVIVDVGTGSGCLAITLALERPSARVIATDISAPALAVARANAARLGATDRIEFRDGPLLADDSGSRLRESTPGVDSRSPSYDLIVANPPYVDPADRPSLPRDVADHEPAVALFAEERGLAVIGALIALAPAALTDGGTLLIEIGQGHAAAVGEMVDEAPGLTLIEIRPDLQGIPRVLVAVRSERQAESET